MYRVEGRFGVGYASASWNCRAYQRNMDTPSCAIGCNLAPYSMKSFANQLLGCPHAYFRYLTEVTEMRISRQKLIGKLKHEINSPLAAIRNALYLVAVRIHDPELERYLKLADAEVSRISA